MNSAILTPRGSMESSLSGRDLVSISDFSKEELEEVLAAAHRLQKKANLELLKGKILASCFFEPSTRTRLSFESAMLRLGGNVIGFSQSDTTSIKKGESLCDSMKVISSYADIIVIRHPKEGSARVAAEASSVPVINAGDGANQHPTQTLIDLFTIQECQKTIDGLHIAIAGDLKFGRTVHSLSLALGLYQVRLYFISPEGLELPETIIQELKKNGVKFSFHKSIEEIISKIDILYMCRAQKERFADLNFSNLPLLKKKHLEKVKPNFKILHPLPKVDEIEESIDETPYAYYFQQAANGVLVRSAILALLT